MPDPSSVLELYRGAPGYFILLRSAPPPEMELTDRGCCWSKEKFFPLQQPPHTCIGCSTNMPVLMPFRIILMACASGMCVPLLQSIGKHTVIVQIPGMPVRIVQPSYWRSLVGLQKKVSP